MSTEGTVELNEPVSTVMVMQEGPGEEPQTEDSPTEVSSIEQSPTKVFPTEESQIEVFSTEDSQTTLLVAPLAEPEPESAPEPVSPRKKSNTYIFALLAVIAGAVIAAVYINKNGLPTAEAPQVTEIAREEPEVALPVPETVAPEATEKAEKPEKSSPALRRLTRAELDKLPPLIDEALSSHEAARGHYRRGDYGNALEHYRKAQSGYEDLLPYYEQSLGAENNNTITIQKNLAAIYNSVGEVYRSKNNYTEALNWLNKSMKIRESVQGDDHPDTARTYSSVALLYASQEKYTEAMRWYRKSLTIYEKTLGTDHPDTAKTYTKLGMLYLHQDAYADAMSLFKKAAVIQEKEELDKNHHAAIAFNNIAEVHRAQGDYVFALPEYIKAYRILRDTHGEEHSTTKGVMRNMTRAYEKLGSAVPFDRWLSESLAGSLPEPLPESLSVR